MSDSNSYGDGWMRLVLLTIGGWLTHVTAQDFLTVCLIVLALLQIFVTARKAFKRPPRHIIERTTEWDSL